jgi:methyl-accepting chemotaxis protein
MKNSVALLRNGTALLVIAIISGAITYGVSLKADRDMGEALQGYRTRAHQETALASQAVATSFDQIYQNLRTISFLASVRRIDRHGTTLTSDGRQAIQQLFNNLAANVAVSEVYIVPIDLDPDAMDSTTHQKQAPTLMFDKVRLSVEANEPEDPVDPSEPVQEESFEYHALRDLMTRLKSVAPKLGAEAGADIPFFTIRSLITCDNSVYNTTHRDADRTGPIFSVPFYAPDGLLKGTISVIMRDAAVAGLLPQQNFALLDTTTGNIVGSLQGGQQTASSANVQSASPDASLFYSEVVPVATRDPNKPFRLWSGRPREEFLNLPVVKQIRAFELVGYLFAGSVGVLGLGLWFLVWRSLRKAEQAEIVLQARLAERTAEIEAIMTERLREREAAEANLVKQEADEARTKASAAAQAAADLIAEGLDQLALGNLLFRLGDTFPSEYETLHRDFNRALQALEDTMTVVATNASAIGLDSLAIATGADDLSRRTAHQAASLEETTAALGNITVTVRKTAEGVQQARGVVAQATRDAENSGDVVRKAVDAMGEIARSSGEIGQIIGVIDEIAFQTNLLALNAGVEAARAGDAGRGFAVVASEVRALAQRSAEAAKDIKALIARSNEQVRQGVGLVGETGEALERIARQVNAINEFVADIAASAEDQATGLSEVHTAVTQMDQITQQNAEMVEEATAASRNLAEDSDELVSLMKRFALKAERPTTRRRDARTPSRLPASAASKRKPVAAERARSQALGT